jgi:glycosyltransferase involved in cell wall biosynthesis
MLEMMYLLKDDPLNFRLLIAGEGRLLHPLQRKVRKLEIEDRVEFLGFVDEMPAFFNSIDIFLLTSHYEGFGYVIAEAMASRRPVVAFDIKSSAEIVEHGVTGYLTSRESVEEMAGRVRELGMDRELREKMGNLGRKRVEELFSFEKNQAEILELITPVNGH